MKGSLFPLWGGSYLPSEAVIWVIPVLGSSWFGGG